MASRSRIEIRVTSSRGHSTIGITSHGRYVSFTTAGYQRTLANQPIITTASLAAFWEQVLNIALANITANPNPP